MAKNKKKTMTLENVCPRCGTAGSIDFGEPIVELDDNAIFYDNCECITCGHEFSIVYDMVFKSEEIKLLSEPVTLQCLQMMSAEEEAADDYEYEKQQQEILFEEQHIKLLLTQRTDGSVRITIDATLDEKTKGLCVNTKMTLCLMQGENDAKLNRKINMGEASIGTLDISAEEVSQIRLDDDEKKLRVILDTGL